MIDADFLRIVLTGGLLAGMVVCLVRYMMLVFRGMDIELERAEIENERLQSEDIIHRDGDNELYRHSFRDPGTTRFDG